MICTLRSWFRRNFVATPPRPIRHGFSFAGFLSDASFLTAAEVEYLQASMADLFKTYVPQDERDVAIRELLEAIDPDGPRVN